MGLFSGLKWIRDKVKNNSGVLSVGAGLATLGYNIFSGERSFREQNRYNDLMMGREDDAVQRRVEDLKKAGLSPVLAAGSPASASAVKVGSAPQVSNSFGDSLMDFARFEQDEKFRKIEADIALQSNQANLTKTQAEVELLDAERREVEARIPLHGQNYRYNEEANAYKLDKLYYDVLIERKNLIEKDFDIAIKGNNYVHSYFDNIRAYIGTLNDKLKFDEHQIDLLSKKISLDILKETYYDKRFRNFVNYSIGVPIEKLNLMTASTALTLKNKPEARAFLDDYLKDYLNYHIKSYDTSDTRSPRFDDDPRFPLEKPW